MAAPEDLPPEVRAAVAAHAERVGAPDPLADVRSVVVTRSEPAGGGGLLRRRKQPHDTWLVLGPELFTVVTGASGVPVVSLYRLREIEVKRYASDLIEDSGLDVTGMPFGATERSSAFVPLDDARGARFEADLRAAIGG